MKRLLSLIRWFLPCQLVLLLFSPPLWAGGLQASFESSRFSGLTRESTIAEYWGDVTGANVLIDHSGENNMTYTEDFSNAAWTKTNVTVTADQVLGPEGSNADLLTPTAADSYVYQDDAGAAAGETHTCAWDIRSVVGNVNLSIHAYNQAHGAIRGTEAITVTPYWRRYSIQGVLVAGDTAVGCTIGGNTTWNTGENLYAVRASSQENDQWRTGPGVYHPVLVAVTKPALDLAQNNNPTAARVHLQMQGNKGPAREYDGTNQDYRLAHDPAINVFDTSHTMTFAVLQDIGAAGFDRIFSHDDGANGGIDVYSANLASWRVRYRAAGGGTITVDGPASVTNDGLLHFVQVVRDGNDVTVYLDGTPGATVDVTGYGDDVAAVIYLGSNNANFLDGQISYTAIRSRALSDDELAEEREMLWGVTSNWSDVNQFSFSRSTTAMKTFSNAYENTYPSHSMDLVPANVPRVTDGLSIESQTTQLHGLTEEFQTWTETGTCAVTANNYVAPNGTLTADLLDNTGGVNTDRRSINTANLGSLTGRDFTASVWIRAATPHNVTLRLFENPAVGNVAIQTFYATTEWQRFDISGTAAGGGDGTLSSLLYPGENGVATGAAHFWAANLTETTFATSYIPNAGVATSQVTRTADDMTIQPVEPGTNNRILADTYNAAGPASKLTVYLEVKCQWSSSADIGTTREFFEISGNAGTASGTRNRVILQVHNAGLVQAFLRDDADVDYSIASAVDVVDYSEWFSIRFVIDFTDLSRMELWINESSIGNGGNSGTASFDTISTMIRVGQRYSTGIDAHCHFRSLRINNQEIRVP